MSSKMVNGFKLFPDYLDRQAAADLVRCVAEIVAAAPLETPRMPRTGKAFSVTMTNAGSHGWFSDKAGGYRYQPCHPATGQPWPDIPPQILAVWRALHPGAPVPQCCLINYYCDPRARMGLHVDRDEDDLRPRSCRCLWGIRRCFASVDWRVRSRPDPCDWPPETLSLWGERRGGPGMASTGFTRAPARCWPKTAFLMAGGSTSP